MREGVGQSGQGLLTATDKGQSGQGLLTATDKVWRVG